MAFGLLKSLHAGPPRRTAETRASRWARRLGIGFAIFIGVIVIAAFILSFFLDSIIRDRSLRAMNENLKGYHAELAKAHLQLIGGALTLSGISIAQEAHPKPALVEIPQFRFHIDWGALFSGKVVADLTIRNPRFHIDLTQFKTEQSDQRSVKDKGWQQAVEALYPFKINRFRIIDGDFVYIDTDPQRPIHLSDLNLAAQNIRNIHSPNKTYPSPIHVDAILAEKGKIILDGDANFLAEPFAGVSTRYWVSRIPLSQFTPALKHANMGIDGGVLDSNGLLEYAPWGERVEVYNATIDGVRFTYLNLPQTQGRQKEQVHQTKEAAKQANNQPGLMLKMDRLNLKDSDLAYEDKTTKPAYRLYFSDFAAELSNVSNHFDQGTSGLKATGKFMDSGATTLNGSFRPEKAGPDFNIDLAIQHTDLTRLNDLLQAYGKLRVARGDFSLFIHANVKQGQITGYVKPLFSDMQVYNFKQDKNKSILKQAYKMAVGAATHIFKNRKTQKVATEVQLSGRLDNPNTSTWQALVQIVRNAFIKAILPGFDREAQQNQTTD